MSLPKVAVLRVSRVLSLALVAPLLAASLRGEQGTASEASKPSEGFGFISAVIQSLSLSNATLEDTSRRLKSKSPVEQMTAIKSALVEMDMAASEMKPFSSEANEYRRDATGGILHAYSTIQESLTVSLEVAELIAAAKSEADLPAIRRRLSDAKMLSEQANKELIEAVVLGFGSCVVTDLKDPANHVALNMTRSERVNLLKDLKTQFGPSLTTEVTDSDAGPLMAAKSLLKGLQQDWRSAK